MEFSEPLKVNLLEPPWVGLEQEQEQKPSSAAVGWTGQDWKGPGTSASGEPESELDLGKEQKPTEAGWMPWQ